VFVPMHRMTHRNVRVMGGCGVVAMLRVLGRRSMMRGRFLEVLRGCMMVLLELLHKLSLQIVNPDDRRPLIRVPARSKR